MFGFHMIFRVLVFLSLYHAVLGAKSDNEINLLTVGSFGNISQTAYALLFRFAETYVNNNPNILPDATLNLHIQSCGNGLSANASGCLITTTLGLLGSNIVGVLSGAFSPDQRVIQYSANAFGKPQISGITGGPILSNKVDYPTFMRTNPSEELADLVMIKYMQQNGWTNVMLVLEDADWGSSNKEVLVRYAQERNITIDSVLCPSGSNDFSSQAEYIKSKKNNIMIMILNPREALILLDAANKTGLIGPNYVWMVPLSIMLASGNLANFQTVLPSNINAMSIRPLLDGAVGFMGYGGDGPLYNELLPKFKSVNSVVTVGYHWYIVDAVLAYAHTIEKMMKEGANYNDGKLLLKQLLTTNFTGTTGYVYYNKNGDRQGRIGVFRFNKTSNEPARIYDPVTDSYEEVKPITFYGGGTNIQNVFFIYEFYYSEDSLFNKIDSVIPVPKDFISVCGCNGRGECDKDFHCICEDGYEGEYCEEKSSSRSLLAPILVPILAGLVIVGIAMFVFFRRKHVALIKDIADRQQSDVPRQDITLQKRIGAGGAGEVYTALFRGTEVAVKQIHSAKLSAAAIQEFRLECAIMCSLRHPNIVLTMGSCYDEKKQEMLLVMEYMQKGSLYGVLHDRTVTLPFALLANLAYQTAQGINFLHQCNPPIIHGDMKSHNVLIDSKWCARISDFGVTKLAKISSRRDDNAEAHNSDSRRSIGTLFWAAPEVLNGGHQTIQSDCYSFGIVLYEIFHRKDPYTAGDPLHIALRVAKDGLRPTLDYSLPPKLISLIERCWSQQPSTRPTFNEITAELLSIINSNNNDETALAKPIGLNVFNVMTKIENSSAIWNDSPDAMKEAVTLLNEMVRREISIFRGVETDYTNETFFITFTNLEDAMNWAIDVNTKLLSLKWPASLETKYSPRSQEGNYGKNGLRLNIAIHSGMPLGKASGDNERMEIEKMLEKSRGGQIVISSIVQSLYNTQQPTLQTIVQIKRAGDFTINENIKEMFYSLNFGPEATLSEISDYNDMTVSDAEILPHAVIDMENIPSPRVKYRSPWDIVSLNLDDKDERIGKSFICDVHKTFFNNQKVVVKKYFSNFNEEILLDFKCNVIIASKFNHPNVLKYIGLSTAPNVMLVQEYMAGGSLKNYLAGNTINIREKIRIAKEAAEGMRYLASFNDNRFSVHPNFRTTNIMLGKNKEVKVTDYSIGLFYEMMRTITAVESVVWTAPEIFKGLPADPSTTVYSFGIMLWEIYTQKMPFEKIHPIKLISMIMEGHRPAVPDDCPVGYKELMIECWSDDAERRPSWESICTKLRNL